MKTRGFPSVASSLGGSNRNWEARYLMTPRPEAKKRGLGLKTTLTPRARAVVEAFLEARHVAPGFLLSCGVLPEVSESVTERLHRVIHYLAGRRFERRRHARALRAAIRKIAASNEAFDHVETRVNALVATETTSAYLFGLAVGLALSTFPERIRM
jgi:hypothetical protein